MTSIACAAADRKTLRAFIKRKKLGDGFRFIDTVNDDRALVISRLEIEDLDFRTQKDRAEFLRDLPAQHGQALRELFRRFRLVPQHARAFGWKHLDDEAVEAFVARIRTAGSDWALHGDVERLDPLLSISDCRILRKASYAMGLLSVDNDALVFAGQPEDALSSIAESEADYTRLIRTSRAFRKVASTEFVAHDTRPSSRHYNLKNTVSVRYEPLSPKQLTAFLKASSPERRLRALKSRHRDLGLHISRVLEIVGSHKGKAATKYVSGIERKAFEERRDAQTKWAADRLMVDGEGGSVSMSTLIEAKRRAQSAQMYAVAKGMQDIAERKGWDYAMLTLTLPGEWHSARTGTASGRDSTWNGSTPTEACRQLQNQWNIVSTRIKQLFKEGGGLGFAMREPHDDGTGHLHVSLVGPREALIEVRDYCLRWCESRGEDVVDEPGVFETTETKLLHFLAWKPSEEFEQDEEKKASSPASYMFKYLSKGYTDIDVASWKACVSIRQVSWVGFGQGFVSKWQAAYQTMRRLEDADPARTDEERAKKPSVGLEGEDDGGVYNLIACMREKLWGDAVAALVGIELPDVQPVELEPVVEQRVTRYQDVAREVVGYSTVDGEILSKKDVFRKWTLQRLRKPEEDPFDEGVVRAGPGEGLMALERT